MDETNETKNAKARLWINGERTNVQTENRKIQLVR